MTTEDEYQAACNWFGIPTNARTDPFRVGLCSALALGFREDGDDEMERAIRKYHRERLAADRNRWAKVAALLPQIEWG